MFSRRASNEADQLRAELEQVKAKLSNAKNQVDHLASQNRMLSAKLHRASLVQYQLEDENGKLELQNRDLQVQVLKHESEAAAARKADTDWQVIELKAALRRQAAAHEGKLASLKHRTKALLTAVLPGAEQGAAGLPDDAGGAEALGSGLPDALASGSQDTPLGLAAEDGPSTPGRSSAGQTPFSLAQPPAAAEAPAQSLDAVNAQVLRIIDCLYSDTLTEEQCLEQLTELAAHLPLHAPPPAPRPAAEAACSPLPSGILRDDATNGTADKVDASTEPTTSGLHMVDEATETPAEMSYMQTPASGATPSAHSPRRGGALPAVPPLDLAALVAQAMEATPESERSTASTSLSGEGSGGFTVSQFVLAQPEKLQRLIMRHAAAMASRQNSEAGATPQQQFLRQGSLARLSSGQQPPAYTPDTVLPGAGGLTARSLTSRLLGLGFGSSSNNTNTASKAMPPPAGGRPAADAGAAAGVVPPSAALPPAAAPMGKKPMSAPKFAGLGAPEPAASGNGSAGSGPGALFDLKPWPSAPSASGGGRAGAGLGKMGSMLGGAGSAAGGLDGDVGDAFQGTSNALGPARGTR